MCRRPITNTKTRLPAQSTTYLLDSRLVRFYLLLAPSACARAVSPSDEHNPRCWIRCRQRICFCCIQLLRGDNSRHRPLQLLQRLVVLQCNWQCQVAASTTAEPSSTGVSRLSCSTGCLGARATYRNTTAAVPLYPAAAPAAASSFLQASAYNKQQSCLPQSSWQTTAHWWLQMA
jgi:hypothetical protein